MAFDYSYLKQRIIDMYGSQTNFAKSLNVSKGLISKKLNSKVGLSQEEVILWSEKLKIPKSEISVYFFSFEVSKS